MNFGQVLRRFSHRDFFYVPGMVLCSLAGFATVTKYFQGAELVAFAIAIAACVTLTMLWLRSQLLNRSAGLKLPWLALPWCAFALLFLVVFPLANRHVLGGVGSDRGDALRVSASALLHGHYPYLAKTYLGNPITPLPGAILLAIPFYLLGNVSLQNLLWLALFLLFGNWLFRSRSTAIVCVLLLLGSSAVNLDDFLVGGDFVINAM